MADKTHDQAAVSEHERVRGRLAWRCRRGTQELDLLLQRYLRDCYDQASPGEQAAFARLLQAEDGDLIHYFLGHDRPADPDLACLVDFIRVRFAPAR